MKKELPCVYRDDYVEYDADEDFNDGKPYFVAEFCFDAINHQKWRAIYHIFCLYVDEVSRVVFDAKSFNDEGYFPLIETEAQTMIDMPVDKAEDYFDFIYKFTEEHSDIPLDDARKMLHTLAVLEGIL